MAGINSLGVSSDIGVQAYKGSEGLSGEAMMAYISTRLNSIDGDINSMMQDQTDNLAKKEDLQHVLNFVSELKVLRENDTIDTAEANVLNDELMTELKDNPTLYAEMESQFGVGYRDYDKHSPDELEVQIEEVKQQIDAVSSDSELTMIRLQQLMSQRQTAIQLTTNMLSKFNQGDEAIVANIR